MFRRVCVQALARKAPTPNCCSLTKQVVLSRAVSTNFSSNSLHQLFSENASNCHEFHNNRRCIYLRPLWRNRYYSTSKFDFSENVDIIESWSKFVDPFGKVTIKGNFNLHIEPIDPHEHPEMNMAFVTIYRPTENDFKEQFKGIENMLQFNIDLTDQGKHLEISGPPIDVKPIDCSVQLPIKFGIQVDMQGDGDVKVSNVESPELNIQSKKGNCLLNNIRAGVVKLSSTGGSIVCRKTLQGNVDIETKNTGAIQVDKIQGSHLKLRTDQGDIQVKSVYGDNAIFWTNTGSVRLGSCHGDTTIDVDHHGDVSIDSLDGDLTANIRTEGNMNTHLTRHGKGDISLGKGDLNMSLSDTVYTAVDLKAHSIDIDEAFMVKDLIKETHDKYQTMTGTIGQGVTPGDALASSIKATAFKGKITLESCDWFSAMNKNQSWKT